MRIPVTYKEKEERRVAIERFRHTKSIIDAYENVSPDLRKANVDHHAAMKSLINSHEYKVKLFQNDYDKLRNTVENFGSKLAALKDNSL
jgi:hypothetical protein